MIWAILVILVLLGYISLVIFLMSNLKIENIDLPENKINYPLRLRVWRSIGFGFFIGCFGVIVLGLRIIFL